MSKNKYNLNVSYKNHCYINVNKSNKNSNFGDSEQEDPHDDHQRNM